MNTPKKVAKPILQKAANLILEKFACEAKYYKAIGEEFYKFNLHGAAREFLACGMAKMNKQLGAEVYSLFTLYEIQYGSLKVAESMIQITVLTYPISKTIRFIGEHVAKLKVNFARDMFIFSLNLQIPFEKKVELSKAFQNFERVHGTAATQEKANNICNQVMQGTDDKAIVIEDSPKLEETGPIKILNSGTSTDNAGTKASQKTSEVVAKNNSTATKGIYNSRPSTKAVDATQNNQKATHVNTYKSANSGVSLKEEKPTPNLLEDDSGTIARNAITADNSDYPRPKFIYKNPDYIEFREKAYIALGVIVQPKNYPELMKIRDPYGPYRDFNIICINALQKYKYDLYLLKEVCLSLFERNMIDTMRKALADAQLVTDDFLTLNNLIVFFKIKSNLLANDINAAQTTFQIHIENCSELQFMNFCENLNELEPSFVRYAYHFCMTAKKDLKFSVILAKYLHKSYELRYGTIATTLPLTKVCSDKAAPYIAVCVSGVKDPVHEHSFLILKYRKSYEARIRRRRFLGRYASDFRKNNKNSVNCMIEAIRSAFFNGLLKHGRAIFKQCVKGLEPKYKDPFRRPTSHVMKKTNKEADLERLKFGYYLIEIDFGDVKNVYDEISTLTSSKPHIDAICTKADILLKQKKFNEFKLLIQPIISNYNIMASPDVLGMLFKFHERWVKNYNFHLFDN